MEHTEIESVNANFMEANQEECQWLTKKCSRVSCTRIHFRPEHLHRGMAEALYVVEGDFTNEGKQYPAGTSLHFKAGKQHGPHLTNNGCRLLVLWTERTSHEAADLSDFVLAKQTAA